MATKTVVTLVDDLTGEEGGNVSTVEFALDGAAYEIDLNEKNADELRDALTAYVNNARRIGRVNGAGKTRRARSAPAAARSTVTSTGPRSREASKAIRDWAKSEGIEVSDRGRISGDVVERYDAAHRS